MSETQMDRFQRLKDLAMEAQAAVTEICDLTDREFKRVDYDHPEQGNQLQRLQQSAGKAVAALERLNVTAKHARAFGAQSHIEEDH